VVDMGVMKALIDHREAYKSFQVMWSTCFGRKLPASTHSELVNRDSVTHDLTHDSNRRHCTISQAAEVG
jgi:hypothetical protein